MAAPELPSGMKLLQLASGPAFVLQGGFDTGELGLGAGPGRLGPALGLLGRGPAGRRRPDGVGGVTLPSGDGGQGHDEAQAELETGRQPGGEHRGQEGEAPLGGGLRHESQRGLAAGGGGLLPGGRQPGGLGAGQQDRRRRLQELLVLLQQPVQLVAGGRGGEPPPVEGPQPAGGGRQVGRGQPPQRFAGRVQQRDNQPVRQGRHRSRGLLCTGTARVVAELVAGGRGGGVGRVHPLPLCAREEAGP